MKSGKFRLWSSRGHHPILLICCVGIFVAAAMFRLMCGEYPLDELLTGIDDWNKYARRALDITRNGWTIPSVQENYVIPAGFLYNYFVAACFILSEDQPAAVYLVQAALLGITVYLVYIVFCLDIQRIPHVVVFATLVLFAFVDVFKYYTFRLLSENLAIFLVMLFFFLLQKRERDKALLIYFSRGLCLAALVLTRPNLLPCAMILVAFIVYSYWFYDKKYSGSALFILGCFLMYALFPLRNYLITGDIVLVPADRSFFDYMAKYNPYSWTESPFDFIAYLLQKILFVFGYPSGIEPTYQLRPHWMIMWTGFFIYIFTQFRNILRNRLLLLVTTFIFSFVIVLVLITQIHNYGYRMLLPGLLPILSISLKGFDIMIEKIQSVGKSYQV